jgi:PhoD-like phosphatase
LTGSADDTREMQDEPALLLGPVLRYLDETAATIWVETDRPCEVEFRRGTGIAGSRARTFEVDGHYYALVIADDLRPGTEYEYQVALDGVVRWPEPDSAFPPSVLLTPRPGKRARIVFGSCHRTSLPESEGYGPDAMAACAAALAAVPAPERPGVLLLIGDQVYADNVSAPIRELIAARRDPAKPPGYEALGFAEYAALYQEAWRDPRIRWLLSVLPTVMIFDDHDVHDDWNTSATWRAEFHAQPWWRTRITGAYSAYWLYAHLGNLSPSELAADETWRRVQACDGDASAILDDLALRADARGPGIRWSVRRDFGGVRVVVIDSRSRRVVDDETHRRMVDPGEWAWVRESVTGDFEHVILATSVPLLLPPGIHAMEAWSEKVCAGAWGRRFARFAEKLRRDVDLEHWAAFGASFAEFEQLLADLAAGAYGPPPATVTVISGDIHNSYLSPVDLPAEAASSTAVWHAVCSPVRQFMSSRLRRAYAVASSAPGTLIATTAARLAGAPAPAIKCRVTAGPWFANMLATLDYDDHRARIRFDRAVASPSGPAQLIPAHESSLSTS